MKISKLIIKLADNELSDKKREKLEKMLYENPQLMKEYKTHLQLNEFLDKEFNNGKTDVIKKNETPEEKSLDAELESLENESYSSTVDIVKEWKEEKKDAQYSNDLKQFASLGIKAKKEKEKQLQENVASNKSADTGKKTILLGRWYFIAATIAAFIVVSVVLFNYLTSSVDNDELYVANYQPYHFVAEQTRSSDLPEDSLINLATKLYLEGLYPKASELALQALNLNKEHVKAQFLYGLTQLEAKNYSSAANEFENILSNNNNYHIEARWYLALCYLKLKRTDEAKTLLEKLGQSKNFYRERALELVKKIE